MFALFATIGEVIRSGFDNWKEVRQAKKEVKIAKLNAEVKRQEHRATWEITMAEATKNSWKDEAILILLSMPYIMSFVPSLQPYVAGGFEFLNTTPQWWQWSWMIAISASYGIRLVPNLGFGGNKK